MITGIKNLPQTPDEFYTLSINRIRGQHDEFKRCLALNALNRLVFAKRALEIVELKHAIYPREDESLFDVRFVTLVTSACAGIVVDSTTNALRLAHHTAEEYLRENDSEIFQDPQSKMAETCLNYLLLNDFSQVGGLRSKVKAEDYRKKYPFLSYAADHWGDHVSFGVRGPVYMLAWNFLMNAQK
jgi:hypothetical protein